MQPPDGGSGSGRRPALVDNAALATDLPELRQHDKVTQEKVMKHQKRPRRMCLLVEEMYFPAVDDEAQILCLKGNN